MDPLSPFPPAEGEDMARKLGEQKGHLFRKGPSWFLRYREYVRGADGVVKPEERCDWIAPATGPNRLTKREAEHKAQAEILDPLNRRNRKPSSAMLVEDFVKIKFQLEVVDRKKKAGKEHYHYLLTNFLLPEFGQRRLCDIRMDDVEMLIARLKRDGYSHQTVVHVKNCVSAVFRHARRRKLYTEENPAHDIDLGEGPVVRRKPTYNWKQAALVMARLKSPFREMARLSVATSMNVAEMTGVRLKWTNFTAGIKVVEGEVLGPYSIAVRENFYRGEFGSLKTGRRRRNVPLDRELAEALAALVAQSKFQDEEAPLFASRNGTPLDAHNIANRTFLPLAKKLGFPITWHAFRRAHSSFAGQLDGLPIEDRVATMGHEEARMTLYYSQADLERRRRIPEEILKRIDAEEVPAENLAEMEAPGGVQ